MTDSSHFKRYRMERPLDGLPEPGVLPFGYSASPWHERLHHLHADAMYQCFRDDLDGSLFPNLADRVGCRFLMDCIRMRDGFCPGATWLLAGPDGYCGTVQGILEPDRTGAIQNLGIAPAHRGRRLGVALVILALRGFARAGARRCALEVTALNHPAVNLYRRCGFHPTRVFYRPMPRAAHPVGI